jgi:hypothetical protein
MELNFHPIYNNDSLINGATTPESKIKSNHSPLFDVWTLTVHWRAHPVRLFKVPTPIGLHTAPLPPGTPLSGGDRNTYVCTHARKHMNAPTWICSSCHRASSVAGLLTVHRRHASPSLLMHASFKRCVF